MHEEAILLSLDCRIKRANELDECLNEIKQHCSLKCYGKVKEMLTKWKNIATHREKDTREFEKTIS